MRTFCSTVTAWPSSSNIITTQAAPYWRTSRAWVRNCSSPSLRLIELTIDLPCTHFSPASKTAQLELSIITGTRATSGSAASRLRNAAHHLRTVQQALVHVDVDDVRPALDLLPGDGHGFVQLALADQPGELPRAGDVGPLADHHEGAVGAEHQRLQAAERPCRLAAAADGGAVCFACARQSPRMWAGVVPQQPPTMFSQPLAANSPSTAAICAGVSS